MKIVFFFIFLLNFFYSQISYSNEIYVVMKVNNKIITNIDISNEYRYLVALRPSLQDVDKKKVLNLAKDSILREKIKEEEIIKHFDLTVENKFIDKIVANFYKKMGMKNENEFINYLKKYNLELEDIRMKISIETAWNDLIYKKFSNKVEIDKIRIKKNIEKIISESGEQYNFLIFEILFNAENYEEVQKKYNVIEKSISEIGFKNTANLHSVSDSAKLGGKIGWINESQLNEIIKREIINLEIGKYTKPITVPGGFLIVKLEDKIKEEMNINFEEEYKKQIANEKNTQLKNFSEIYFKKIKKNATISEK